MKGFISLTSVAMNCAHAPEKTVTETIAIVERDSARRSSLVHLLNTMEYETELYDSAETFLASVNRSKASYLIIDANVGTLCGLDLVRHPAVVALKRPIILHNDCNDSEIRKLAIETGCAAVLHEHHNAPGVLIALIRAAERRLGPFD